MDFEAFPKMARLSRDCVITEKLDGTNAQIVIGQWQDFPEDFVIKHNLINDQVIDGTDYCMFAGSRTRYLTLTEDNFGFAKWVSNNWQELIKLEKGRHFGEWWGKGIQRNYGLTEKRFSLFNTGRWNDENKPACCHLVPVLWHGLFDTLDVDNTLEALQQFGSRAAPGFMKPEGIVIWHEAARQLFKKTLENDSVPKGMAA